MSEAGADNTTKSVARAHAESFLLPIDTRYSMRRLGKHLIGAAETDEEIGSLFDAIQALGDGRSIIEEEHSQIFERVKCSRAIPDIPTAPEWLRPLIAAGYLRAKASLASRSTPILTGDLKKSLRKVLKMAEKVETDFLGELLVETTLAARDDAGFAQELNKGAAEFRSLVGELYSEIDSDSTKSTALAAAANTGGGSGSCRACRTMNGTRQCTPISCWVIVVIVIVIIVAK